MSAVPAAPTALLAVGQLFLDLVYAQLPVPPEPGREVWTPDFAWGPGGVANQAVAGARLGAATAVAAWTGTDAFSTLCLDRLAAEGVDTASCRTAIGWSLPVTASLALGGDRALVTGGVPADGAIVAADRLPAAATAVVDLGAGPADWVPTAAAAGTMVHATIGWDGSGRWDPAALEALAHCAVFQPNAAEALAYTGAADPLRAARALAERVPLAVVTQGGGGVVAVDSATGAEAQRPGIPVDAVDTTGAGDVFGAALALSSLPGWSLDERLDFASLVAAITVTRAGGASTAPRAAELVPWLDAHPRLVEPGRFDFVRRAFADEAPNPFSLRTTAHHPLQ